MKYKTHRIIILDVWLPPGVSANMINYISQLKANAAKVDRIKRLFSRKTCVLSKRSMRMIAGFSLHNSGGSDQAFSLALAVAWKALFLEIDLDVTNEQLAIGTPCQTTFSNAEYKCSAECLLMVANEMKECKYYALSQGAGHRQGLEHLVKIGGPAHICDFLISGFTLIFLQGWFI